MEVASVGIIAFFVLIVVYVALAVRQVKEHEQGIVMRFGKFYLVTEAGLQLVVPGVDRMKKVDLRQLSVVERIDPDSNEGKVQIWGEWWPARSSDGRAIEVGAPIKVDALDGPHVVVRQTGPA